MRTWWSNSKAREWYRETEFFIQRGRRGWSDRDAWSVDAHLAYIVPPMLARLKEGMGYPGNLCYEGDQRIRSDEEAEALWYEILDDISFAFKVATYVLGEDEDGNTWIYWEEPGERIVKLYTGIPEIHIMTVEELERFHKGMELFHEYFFALWD